MNSETICAPATAPGGALGVIRVSGPQAFSAVSRLCPVSCDTVAANTVHYTRLVAPCAATPSQPEVIDEAVVTIYRAPHSYTGEDSVEISCHGSRYILQRVLDLLCQHGCRMARPGEFTMRAYLNGKMDLSQAEAVADLIASTNRATQQMAMSQLRGHFSSELSRLREQLLRLTALLELELDFSDHEDLEFADRSELLSLARTIENHVASLADTFETGQAIKQGIPVAIVGKTNVGKSTLLNRLVHDERAIVSDIHGTTRDTIEDTIDIRGITFRFIDTAGIRQTSDQVEQMGIGRTYKAITKARVVLWLIDEKPADDDIQEIEKLCNGKSLIIIQNKIDASPSFVPVPPNIPAHASFLRISAKKGLGLDALEAAIYDAADIPSFTEADVIVSNARHYQVLTEARQHLLRIIDGLQHNLSGDLLAEHLRAVTDDCLSQITGQAHITPSEVLETIFRDFCIGK